jgi:hypothetical protein
VFSFPQEKNIKLRTFMQVRFSATISVLGVFLPDIAENPQKTREIVS